MYLGIDLGTTNSAIAGNMESEIRIFKTTDGADILPSVIYIDKRGHRLYGQRAYQQAMLSPNNVAKGFKRLMGTSTNIDFSSSGEVFTPEDCSADILKQLVGQAFTESGMSEITGTIITIPAAFNQMQSEATIRASRTAGLEKVGLLQEPIAASMAVMSNIKNKSGQFLVYDLGGGTFDLALVQSVKGSVNVIAHEGINMLGGGDFDRVIVNNVVRPWLMENFNLPTDFQKQEKYRKLIRIAQLASEKAKIELSTRESETIFASEEEVRVTDESGSEIFMEIEFTRPDLENLITDYVGQTIELSRKILKESGYSNEDVDWIVFIGGPTKMPSIRDTVPRELGIPADLKTDPMTAVAQGAAIYCESRDWSHEATERKSSRISRKIGKKINLKYDFPSRISEDRAIFSIRPGNESNLNDFEIQIDSATGWTSGKKEIADGLSIEVPVEDIGKNSFKVFVFDPNGAPVSESSAKFSITRTHASAAGIPVTQTISVKVRDSLESTVNVLSPLIEKGTLLPIEGTKSFKAAKDLKESDKSHIDFELYQDEGVPEPELNLCIGVFRISSIDLPDGTIIRSGDDIIFHWSMNDNGLLSASIELPDAGLDFKTPKFFVSEAKHQSFDLTNGSMLAENVLTEAEDELNDLEQALGVSASIKAENIQKQIKKQKETLDLAHDADTLRTITESARHIRQDIARMKWLPENREKVLEMELSLLKSEFNKYCRENTDQKISNRFDQHALKAQRAISKGNEMAFKEVEAHLKEMDRIYMIQLWENSSYIIWLFKTKAQESYLASDKEKFDELVRKGFNALESDNVDELRPILFEIYDNQITIGSTDKNIAKLSSVMRA